MNKGFSSIALLVGGVMVLVGFLLGTILLGGSPSGAVAGPNVTFPITFQDGATLAGGNLVVNSGREIDLNNCGTALFRPGSLSPITSPAGSSQETTTVSVTGLSQGDSLIVNYDPASPTSSLGSAGVAISGLHASSGVAVVQFANLTLATSAAVANSGTIRVCYFD